MRITALLTAVAAGALIAGAAQAQPSMPPPTTTDGTQLDQVNDSGQPVTHTEKTTLPANATPPIAPPAEPTTAMPATSAGSDVSATEAAAPTVRVVSNPPVPDTAENRAKYGGPDSRGGRRTAARGN